MLPVLCASLLSFLTILTGLPQVGATDDSPALRESATAAMQKAGSYFSETLAVRGGYVYLWSADLTRREGEGIASPTEIWVQPPGTPSVGDAFLDAWEATGHDQFLSAAKAAGHALAMGQLESGGWSSAIEFNPKEKDAGRYRLGGGRQSGRNYSTLDDDKTQAALRFLMRLDQAGDFRDRLVHEAVIIGIDAVLGAQFPNGGFPQGWQQRVSSRPVVPASFPEYDWRSEGRIKEYWDHYTLNDNLASTTAYTLDLACKIYGDDRCRRALEKLGDFLILAQMPEPQPAWAQQYNPQLQPMWARKFEPPAIAGAESEDAVRALLFIYSVTGDKKYLGPVPSALQWMEDSRLSDGRLARFYELRTNRPLYFYREGPVYHLTYDDTRLPDHYSFKTRSRLDNLRQEYQAAQSASATAPSAPQITDSLKRRVRNIIADQDKQGRWLTTRDGSPLPAAASQEQQWILSKVFIRNMQTLSRYVRLSQASAKD